MNGEEDATLVAAVRAGSREAAAELARRYLTAARAVAISVLRDLPGAEDVCQDAFVYAIERIDDCRQPSRFGAWLLQIVRNRARNYRRDSRVDQLIPVDEHPLPSPIASPAEEAERTQFRERLLSALERIPEDRAEVLLLHDLEGWTHREIAERMEIPPGTVRSHLHHARRRLRELLGEFTE
jgi:RNA polymerase sigma-70 factor (ECF subfamily)